MTDNFELNPLTPEQQAEFERYRISAEVVQHKCEACGAWYETARLETEFTETFECDCGARMSFLVPAREKRLRKPTNEQIISLGHGDFKLDTGMTAQEAIRRACAWWEGKGRHMMRQNLQRQKHSPASSDKGMGAPFAVKDPDDPSFLPSGLIHGEPWDALDRREKIQIVKIWHHFNVRRPDVLGEDPNERFMVQDRGTVQ